MKIVREFHRPKSIDAVMTDRAGWTRRLFIVLPLAMLLLGPTPGAVGSCNHDAEDNPVLDTRDELIDYCQSKEQLICYRRQLREEIDADEFNECGHEAKRLCEIRYWSPDCLPTQRQADACLRALSAVDTLDTDESEIKECSEDALCNVERDGPEPSDLDAGDEP